MSLLQIVTVFLVQKKIAHVIQIQTTTLEDRGKVIIRLLVQ